MHLTLPKWLQPNISIAKQRQMTHDNSVNEKMDKEKDLLQQTPSLSYLDDYIHQYF
ncbi:elongation factor G [Cyanothece sp. BG0011]|uniref:elongation factor G n=1 Tax=Cyanothece sp. BG0011 TaxID=2082950 RepID=UPI000D1E3943|nr:elongation factor G [Cyanothece sp. BG0011]